METIEIALAADGGYFDQLFVTATSMAAYCRTDDAELRFNILDGGIREADWAFLVQKITELHQKSSFNRIAVDQSMFDKFPIWNGNRMAYARLILPEALKNKDWVLYSDCDFLWLRDVAELWKERDDTFAVLAVRDGEHTVKKELVWAAVHNFQLNEEEYFCSGMCLFNLNALREERIISKSMVILENHQDVLYVDQSALNLTCQGRVRMLEGQWMCFAYAMTKERHSLPSVIHYAGHLPWKIKNRLQIFGDAFMMWHQFNSQVRGVSLWRSMRKYFSPFSILTRRGLCYAMRFPLARWLLWLVCMISGHRGVFDFWLRFSQNFRLPLWKRCCQ